MLTEIVDRLLDGLADNPEVQLRGASLRELAEVIDSDEASAGVRPQLHSQLVKELDSLVDAAGAREGLTPRLGQLRGEQARLVLLGLGVPPERVDEWDDPHGFGVVVALQISLQRRRAGLQPNPALDAVLDASRSRAQVTEEAGE